MSIHLILSNNSVRNTTVNCDSLGIHYEVSKSNGVVTVSRWESSSNRDVVVGQFEFFVFKNDKIRLGATGEWRLLGEVLHKNGGAIFSTARSFTGDDGKRYRWKTRWDKLLMCEDTGEKSMPALVTYHRKRFKERSYLEVSDPSVLRSLDMIIITFLIMEKKKRDREKRRRRAAGGGGGP